MLQEKVIYDTKIWFINILNFEENLSIQHFCNFYCCATCWYKCSTPNQCISKLSHMLM